MNTLRPLFPCYWCQWAISLTLALTTRAKTNVSLGFPAQVPACGGEFIILDFANPFQPTVFEAVVLYGFWERFGSQGERPCWVWDGFSGLVGWPLSAGLNISVVGAAKKLFSLLLKIYLTIPTFYLLLPKMWKTLELTYYMWASFPF